MKDRYIISIITLSILLLVNIFIIVCLVIISTDLRDTTNVYKNTIDICNTDLEQVQTENESLRNKLLERIEK